MAQGAGQFLGPRVARVAMQPLRYAMLRHGDLRRVPVDGLTVQPPVQLALVLLASDLVALFRPSKVRHAVDRSAAFDPCGAAAPPLRG
eukprot:3428977-Alexandrium_andersonii.AAC.1